MIEAQKDPTPAELEAADWFSRMMQTRIENEDLAAFAAWRRVPEHLAAYNRIEDISHLARGLRDDPQMRAMALQARRRRDRRPSWLRALSAPPQRRWIAGLAFAGLIAAAVLTLKALSPTYQTPVGGLRQLQLADGTQVELNTDTALNVRFTDGVRRVELIRGQAFFEVAHDATAPFIVSAGDTEVRAIGTRFDVRLEPHRVKVVLAEGKVSVSERGARSAQWMLSPGQAVTTDGSGDPAEPVGADVALETGWRTGRLTFRDTPLADAVREINRYSRNKIVLGPGAPLDGRVNGVFPVAQPDDFVAAMTTLYGLREERRLDGKTELRGPEPPST
jgi:transmembrane sensor